VLASLLFPDHLNEYSSYEEYFESRRKWFYGFLTLMFVVDVLDTAIKGRDYLLSFGSEYLIRQGMLAAFSFLLIFVQARRFQKLFVFLALLYQLVWIFRMFEIIR
jgi:hypothetical protein